MPNVARKLLVFATTDGLVVQPYSPRHHPPTTQPALKIDYEGNIEPWLENQREEDTASLSLEVHGIVGLLHLGATHFLIAICNREEVAQIRNKPIYSITDVALIPLSSQADAVKAITTTHDRLRRDNKPLGAEHVDDSGASEDDATSVTDSLVEDNTAESREINDALPRLKNVPKGTSFAEDVIQRKGVYGRFAEKWFSRKGWSADNRRLQGMGSDENASVKVASDSAEPTLLKKEEHAENRPGTAEASGTSDNTFKNVRVDETPKAAIGNQGVVTVSFLSRILQTTAMYFSSGNFFFSYDYDLSHSFHRQQINSGLPLFKQYDPLFFWNQHIVSPFIKAGQHSFVLPIIQGFVGQRSFTIKVFSTEASSLVMDPTATPDDIELKSWHEKQKEKADSNLGMESSPDSGLSPPSSHTEKEYLLTLISRRSVRRAGLRYLRRGTDDDGCTANSVETEQLLSSPTWNMSSDTVFSFSQFRGSIPLFFSQSPYSLKPQVNTWGSFETNARAFRRHFADLHARHGQIYCASLVDKHGNEEKIGELYDKHVQNLNENGGIDGKGKQLSFQWFDFHSVCRGMRFENVSVLVNTLESFMSSSSWVEMVGTGVKREQRGVIRTNCMDCLDRTNVVQSACARTVLELQLSRNDHTIDLQHDPSTAWFNTLWADNGDAISRQYAGTAALKGDFTRTRKRQITGALTDFGLTLTRYYNNIVNDYFAQAVIDYLLGRATAAVFAEFEADMKNSDYFIDIQKVRQQAIERSAGIVIEDQDEDFIQGWTLSVPTTANQVKTATFEEAVLLLTDKALYFCRLDWGTEKVREFERIRLESIQGVARGVYITSTLAQRHTEPAKNVGFIVRYRTGSRGKLVRRNTRSLESETWNHGQEEQQTEGQQKPNISGRFLAFKALPARNLVASDDAQDSPENEVEMVSSACEEIARAANKLKKVEVIERSIPGIEQGDRARDSTETEEMRVEEKDIISLEDAKKSTGYLEQFEYSLKKLVWG